MKAVILAGGFGTRLSEETTLRPKPMVEVGGKPLLWHIMKMYSSCGINDFIICCGYRGYMIKEYFANYLIHHSDVTFDMSKNTTHFHDRRAEPWKVTLVDTGDLSMTGGRLKRVSEYIKGDNMFCLTYGDGVADINFTEQIKFHIAHQRLATITAVRPAGRFGALDMDGTDVKSFVEKPKGDGGFINGGFFILSPEVLNLIDGDHTIWEEQPLKHLAKIGQLQAFIHNSFWQPMDTMRDKHVLESLWDKGNAPWQTWL